MSQDVLDLTDEAKHANMSTIIVKKDRLLETLQQNREKHREIFEEALAGYKQRSIELLEEHIERINSGSVERVFVSLPVPEDHTEDYDRAIDNLTWSIYDTVELSAREFDSYVRDAWAWKQEFVTTSSMYAGSAKN